MRSRRSCTKAIASWSCAQAGSLETMILSASASKNSGRSSMPNNDSFFKAALRRHDVQIAGIVVVMAIVFSILAPGFLSASNLGALLENYSVMAIMAAGLLVVLISGGLDISFAAIAAISQYLMVTILVRFGGNWLLALRPPSLFCALLLGVEAFLCFYLKPSAQHRRPPPST